MELFEEENVQKEKKTKNVIVLIASLIVILIIVAVGLFFYINHLQSLRLKVSVNSVMNSAGTDNYVFAEDGTLYISIRDFASLAGYSYYNGGYKQYTEDASMCHVISSYEVASFEVNSSEYYKVELGQQEDQCYFKASRPIIQRNGKLYATEEVIEKAFNTAIAYSAQTNTISIVTLDYLITTYTARYTNAAIAGTGNVDFSIQKAALYNYIVTVNPSTKLYGVSEIDANGNLREVIGEKYLRIQFVETNQDFIVTTEDNKKGLITNDGVTRIRPEYDELKLIDNDYNLYLIRTNQNYGVINKSGKYIVYPEFEEIGIDKTLYPRNNIKNPYLLYDNCIPVRKNRKWALIDKNGKALTQLEYDSIGCTTTTQRDKSTNNMLLIEEYEGIVVGKDKLYGLLNSLGEEILPCALSDIYSVTNSGKDTIYMTYMTETVDLINYLQTNGIVKKSASDENNTGSTQQPNNTTTPVNNTQTNINGLQGDTTMVTDNNVVNPNNQNAPTQNPQQTQPQQTQQPVQNPVDTQTPQQ